MKNILMVDNDRIFLFTMSRLLEKEGHRVTAVDSGLKAIDILKTEVPDVILVDLVMPRIDGVALCRFIRKKPETAYTPIVIVSATSMEESRHSDRLDINGWIAKATPRENRAPHPGGDRCSGFAGHGPPVRENPGENPGQTPEHHPGAAVHQATL